MRPETQPLSTHLRLGDLERDRRLRGDRLRERRRFRPPSRDGDAWSRLEAERTTTRRSVDVERDRLRRLRRIYLSC